jgi:hypothetical protein
LNASDGCTRAQYAPPRREGHPMEEVPTARLTGEVSPATDNVRSITPRVRRPSACERRFDAHPWACGYILEGFGVRVGVRASSPLALPSPEDFWPLRLRRDGDALVDCVYSIVEGGAVATRRGLYKLHLAFAGAVLIARSREPAEISSALRSAVHHGVASASRDGVFVHAGAVSIDDMAVLLPARSHAGKTSLVQALLARGATYISDEYAVLDAQGLVQPYPKPLSLRSDGARTLVWPRELHAASACRPLRVGLVVATRHEAGASFRPVPMTRGETSLALLANAVQARTRPAAALRAIARATSYAQGVRGVRGEAADACPRIEQLVRALREEPRRASRSA